MKIKVCGMHDKDNISELVELYPDYIGFILYPGSKRFVGNNYVVEAFIPSSISKVGVFVNALINEVLIWTNRLNLDLVQLHGSEHPEYCLEIHNLGLKIIKAFGITPDFDFNILDEYQPYCDYFLFDTKTNLHGGSGLKFDWKILENYTLDTPYFLSGGIESKDIDILSRVKLKNLHAVDINSGFEIAPGYKDISLVNQFISIIRSKHKEL
jgi:phosphoribosylanthranilate isomerase